LIRERTILLLGEKQQEWIPGCAGMTTVDVHALLEGFAAQASSVITETEGVVLSGAHP
jgi:hypothetical protein